MTRALMARLVSAALAGPLFPAVASAQPAFQMRPLFGISQTYDTNLMFESSNPQADLITRATPGLDARYRTPLVTLDASYILDAQRFADHQDLSALNGHRAAVGLQYAPTSRLKLGTATSFRSTRIPSELNTVTAFALRRADTYRVAVDPSISYAMGLTTKASVDYSLARDRVVGGVDLVSQTAAFTVERQASERTVGTVRFAVQRFDFNRSFVSTSEVATVGVSRRLTEHATLKLAGGPRVTDGRLAPEIGASISVALPPANVSLGFTQTESTIVGVAGAASTQGLAAATLFRPWRGFELQLTPSAFRIVTENGEEARIYRATIGVSRAIASTLALVASYEANVQTGNIYPTVLVSGFTTISRQVVSIGFVRNNLAGLH